jgi:hypothetical protein
MAELAQRLGLELVERAADGNAALEEGEAALLSFDDVQLILSNSADQGLGHLIITEGCAARRRPPAVARSACSPTHQAAPPSLLRRRVVWLGAAGGGFAVGFRAIAMHAAATDPGTAPRPCLFLALDAGDSDGEGGSGEEGVSAEEAPARELRLVPADAAQVEPIFAALSAGAERNPDPGAEEEAGGAMFFDRDEALAGAFGSAEFGEVEALVAGDPGRFEDPAENGN